MVLSNGEINIIADMEGTTGVKLHNNRQKLRARFDIRRKLGQGTYGKVQLAVNKETGEEVAIKTIKKSKIETEQDLVRIQREIQIMSSVQHPHIIHIYEVFENREKIVLVMEYASGGELYDYLSFKKVLTEAEARRVFRQVASAVFYCHKNMICHRDLKLENILLDERGNAKIADFGLSNIFNERNFLSTFCGSPLYASPEIVQGTPYYGPEVDCWSLGVLLYTLVYGAMPFDGSNFKKLVKQISEGDYYEPRVPADASGLIRKMLTVDPAKRATVDDICCDRWVDISEEVPLLDVAQEMCKLMPVRLDYLLALTAAPPPPETETDANKDVPKVELDANGLNEEISPQYNNAKSALGEDEDDTDQWERPALQALTSATALNNKDVPVNGELNKKHKLTPSSSILGGSSAILNKKKKNEDQPLDDDDDKGGGAEKISQPVESMEAESTENNTQTITPITNGPICENVQIVGESEIKNVETQIEEQGKKTLEETNGEGHTESKPSTEPSASETANLNVSEPKVAADPALLKRKPSINKKSPSLSTTNGTAKAKKNQSDVGTGETEAKVASTTTPTTPLGAARNLKLKKSTSKDGGAQSSNEAGTATPPSAGSEKRKISFPPSRISDVKKSFERKSPEKKPVGPVGSKISSVRNKFESPPTTPESASGSIKPPLKSLANNTSSSKASIVKSVSQSKENQVSKVEEAASEAENVKKSAILARQPSTGNVRQSPTKTLRTDKTSAATTDQSGQHHKGCVPHDARLAAAQEAKKSPPKTIAFKRKSPPLVPTTDATGRKNSLSKTGSGISRMNSKNGEAPLPRRLSAGNGSSSTISHTSSSTGLRPRSPTKSMKAKTNIAKRTDPSPLATSTEPAEITGTAKSDDGAVQNDVPTPSLASQTSEQVEEKSGLDVDKEETKNEKRGSIEIAPLPSGALVRRYPEEDEEGNVGVGTPLVRFIPRDQSGFHLIGVKSEVLFDVAAGEPENLPLKEEPTPVDQKNEVDEKKVEPDEDSKIIRYIATVRRHGSTDDQLDDGPERVTLIDLRCSATSDDLANPQSPASSATKNSKPDESAVAKQEAKTSAKSEELSTVVEDSSSTEQRGYSVYRSKYRSIQKFRSVVEKRGGEEGEAREENASTKASVEDRRAPSLERSDSFSSTGSNDDLEDVFESLTSESLFTSLLSRTRNLINRLTEGDAHTTRWFQSSLLGRSGIGISGTIPSSVSSFVLNTPNISVRFNQPASTSRRNYSDSPKSTYRISARSGDAGRNNSAREYDAEAANYTSDSCNSSNRGPSRWRTKARCGDEEDDMAFLSDTGGSARLRGKVNFRSQSSYSNFNSNRSVLVSSSLRSKEDLAARRSRYDSFRTRDWQDESPLSQREEARSDVLSALLRHRNRSLDTRTRPRSFYEPEQHDGEWSPSAGKCTLPPSQRPSQSNSEAKEMDRESLYGTVRRPTRFQRYSKSVSKELSEEYESEESNLHRPRSMVVLTEPKDGKAASVSVSRDYSKNVSQSGTTKKEEEEEYEHEHRITKEAGGRVTTTRRETKRSVSQTQDTDGDRSSASQTSVGSGIQNAEVLNRPIKKQGSGNGDHLSRQDSGIGSMHDSSAPATPTSAGIQPRKGYARFARSVSNELESLEEEINRIGLGATKSTPADGERGHDCTDGRTTPASDSAETGSVCSDTTASTDTLNSSQQLQKESEEESVGDRIRRKSFFARFNESSRIPRKGRAPGSTLSASSSTASMRSELGHTPGFRHHHHYYDDDPAFASSRSYFEPSPDFYSGALNRHGGANQRWSMHLGGNSSCGNSNSDYLYGGGEMPAPSSRRRESNGGNPDVMAYLRRSADTGNEDCCEPGMMNRTHSLPEEANPPSRPVFRQHSMPSGSNGNGNCPAGGEIGDHPTQARRPSRLGLRTRNYPSCEETGEMLATSPSATSASGRSWRRSRFGSGSLDPLDAWDTSRNRAGPSFSSLMGTLESPSEVLQKAMDLCDSLRFS